MSESKHHINPSYSAADILRYLKGELSAKEMYAMEKAALDDPFLADAIDGMESAQQTFGVTSINSGIEELKTALNSKVSAAAGVGAATKATVKTLSWWKIGAAAAAVITGALITYNIFLESKDEAPQTVAKNEKTVPLPLADSTAHEEAATSSITDTATLIPGENNWGKLTTKDLPAQKSATQKPDQPIQPEARLREIKKEDLPPSVASVKPDEKQTDKGNLQKDITGKVPENKIIGDTVSFQTEVVGLNNADLYRGKSVQQNNATDPKLLNIIKGRVTDQFNRPLPNAFLQNEANQMAFTTDRNGYFNIPTRDSALNVSVSAQGFQTQKAQLQNRSTSNAIVLQPMLRAFEEVVEVGQGKYPSQKVISKTRQGPLDRTVDVQDVEPVPGWLGFEEYVSKNKRPPSGSPILSGEVVVTFFVNKKGELSGFKIAKSLSRAHDEEAIRLIKEGPAWKLLEGRRAKGTVVIRF